MIDYEGIRTTIAKGLREYLGCPIIRSNQNEPSPSYPYGSYTVITLMSENKGTYGEYEDGKARKAFTQTWSITFQSDDNSESVTLACKAREWLDYVGKEYLNNNDVIIQSVGGIHNRDNFLTIEYEYRNGFDFVVWLLDEVGGVGESETYIDTVQINDEEIDMPKTIDELNDLLGQRLDGEKNSDT